MEITRTQLVAAYTAWEARFRDEPKTLLSEDQMLELTPREAGERSADFLVELLGGFTLGGIAL